MSERLKGIQVWITYEEARKLLPFFRTAYKRAEYPEARESAYRIMRDLENVRDLDYGPLPGSQVVLSQRDHTFLMDVITQMELR